MPFHLSDSIGSAAFFAVTDIGEVSQEAPPRGDDFDCIVTAEEVRTLGSIEIMQKKNDLVQAIEEFLRRGQNVVSWQACCFFRDLQDFDT